MQAENSNTSGEAPDITSVIDKLGAARDIIYIVRMAAQAIDDRGQASALDHSLSLGLDTLRDAEIMLEAIRGEAA